VYKGEQSGKTCEEVNEGMGKDER